MSFVQGQQCFGRLVCTCCSLGFIAVDFDSRLVAGRFLMQSNALWFIARTAVNKNFWLYKSHASQRWFMILTQCRPCLSLYQTATYGLWSILRETFYAWLFCHMQHCTVAFGRQLRLDRWLFCSLAVSLLQWISTCYCLRFDRLVGQPNKIRTGMTVPSQSDENQSAHVVLITCSDLTVT